MPVWIGAAPHWVSARLAQLADHAVRDAVDDNPQRTRKRLDRCQGRVSATLFNNRLFEGHGFLPEHHLFVVQSRHDLYADEVLWTEDFIKDCEMYVQGGRASTDNMLHLAVLEQPSSQQALKGYLWWLGPT